MQKTQGDSNISSRNASKNVDDAKPGSSGGVAGNFVSMTEIRNKVSCFRDLLDLSPCLGSATLPEVMILVLLVFGFELKVVLIDSVSVSPQLLILTLCDIFQRYPEIKPVSEFKDASFHEVNN